jgi:type VI secretion system secreted protein VgrG
MAVSSFISSTVAALGLLAVAIQAPQRAAAATILGSAESFSVLGATTVTNTGATTLVGNLGLYPGTSITDLGTISLTGTTDDTDAAALAAQSAATAAYNVLATQSPTVNLSGQNLGGLTLTPGFYNYNGSAQLTGTLVLNFAGLSNTEFVFQIASMLTTASASAITVEGGNSTDGIFFDVGSSATLGSGTVFAGNILAETSISFDSTAEILCGRAIALTGAVTMIGNTVTNTCAGAGAGGYSGGPLSAPEPATFAILGSALVGLFGFAMRRRQGQAALYRGTPVPRVS